ncbi:uncharacterized LOC105270531 [Fopius arisanus]|uniref:Uncharacterized LOC105270531 n=1 Tax=Fopius arisanus TaxID=64838 RepID=A0AAR9IRR4_9HYME|nr:uncharacterized LOC105270531 [Fopius arisanus]KAG8362569.1 pif-4 [Fopius arisanus]
METVFFLVVTFLVISIMIYIRHIYRPCDIGNLIDYATKESALHPTVFKIYDKSTPTRCDRFIIVLPFDWYIWAVRGELYVVNPEGGIQCTGNNTPAVRILKDKYFETCLTIQFPALFKAYTHYIKPKIVPYDIDKPKFTVLSALDILGKRWITFNMTEQPANVVRELDENHKIREVPRNKRSIESAHRSITGRNLIDIMGGGKSDSYYEEKLAQVLRPKRQHYKDWRDVPKGIPGYSDLCFAADNSDTFRPTFL